MRLFVALDLTEEVRRAAGEAASQLRSKVAEEKRADARGMRWSRPEGMHVTLKFIGHAIDRADTARFDAARAALATVHSNAPVAMRFRGAGFFPDARRPRVVWCGVEASSNLAQLAADIERALEPIGIPNEGRPFVPHLTLARFARAGRDSRGTSEPASSAGSADSEFAKTATEMAGIEFGSSRETEFHLFESLLKPAGAEYRKLETYSFWKDAA